MKKELFDELLESVREGGEILRGERAPSRSFHFDEIDVRNLREKHGRSQSRFAAMMGAKRRGFMAEPRRGLNGKEP